jgi:hypothetical protein
MIKTYITIFLSILFFFIAAGEVLSVEKVSGASGSLTSIIEATGPDIRVKKLTIYLERHNSPLAPHAEYFVQVADEYNFGEDWALVAAIAGVESTFGKFTPKNSYNAWGWGIPTGAQSGIGFEDWEHGIDTVSRGLREKYINRGYNTPEKMMRIYAPPSKTWAGNVRFFMDQIESTSVTPELSL